MGNRAIITTRRNYETNGAGIYLHWNGGRDSVEAFLAYARFKGVRDSEYGLARLLQYIGNWFGGNMSLGLVPAKCGAGDDNGVYIIDDNMQIVGREEIGDGFTEQAEYNIEEMLISIDEAQPLREQIGQPLIHSMLMMEKYPLDYSEIVELLQPGTEIYMQSLRGTWERFKVIGYGQPGQIVNGHDAEGIPYVDRYDGTGDYSTNANNYIWETTTVYFA